MKQEEYTPPKSDIIDTKRLSIYQACILVFSVLIAAGCYYIAHVFPIKFMEVFESFNVELPVVTGIVIKTYPLFIFLSFFSTVLLIGLASFMINYRNQLLIYRIAKINAFLSFILLIVVVISMYLPVLSVEQ
ncbi:hypothetical protein FLL45_18480 [Aliikangiella marina]|uniref:Uncharacterized protein n=1 Tax=Aliikangiella marina TaxID=1712262 RepID=A0A545T4S3_9GAMM|nr:hypothetical protein [Aliikangiella marina]TQV72206.1 hypothetical protein FLL45_18480 [Aliikangiella marina]